MAVIKDSLIYISGEVIKKSIPFLMLPYLSRKLGATGFGELAYYQIYISLFVVIVGLSQASSVARYFYKYGSKGVNNLIMSNLLYSIVVSLLFFLPLYYFQEYLIIIALCIALFQELLSSYLSLLQCKRNPLEYTLINICSALISVFVTILLFEYLDTSVELRLLSMLIAYFIVWFFCFYRLNSMARPKMTRYRIYIYVKYMVFFGLPLLGHQMSIFMKGQLDRFVINEYYSLSDLGVYSAGFQISLVFSVVIMAINRAVTPYLYSAFKKNRITSIHLIKIAIVSTLFAPLPAFFAALVDEKYYLLLLGSDFVGVKYYAVLFILGQMLLLPYVILMSFYFYHGKTKVISIITMSTSAIYVSFLFTVGKSSMELLPIGFLLCNLIPTVIIITMLLVSRYREIYD